MSMKYSMKFNFEEKQNIVRNFMRNTFNSYFTYLLIQF